MDLRGAVAGLLWTIQRDLIWAEEQPYRSLVARHIKAAEEALKNSAPPPEAPLREALVGLLNSADCTWYERNAGHDWRDAVDIARAALAALVLTHKRTADGMHHSDDCPACAAIVAATPSRDSRAQVVEECIAEVAGWEVNGVIIVSKWEIVQQLRLMAAQRFEEIQFYDSKGSMGTLAAQPSETPAPTQETTDGSK